ncbi:MAG: L-seryl-tRNA(Sec) selenium transferase [Chloroflexota bacterium]|nr:MAG: L-seryl-tRNA(Sec) selenium transferase [Chloroflexota bacterium]
MKRELLRQLPSVDKLLLDARVQFLIDRYSHAAVVGIVRGELEAARGEILAGSDVPSQECLTDRVERRVRGSWEPSPRHVINATGVILHTNLGRAPLSRDAVAAMQAVGGYVNLEFDLATGARGSRHEHLNGVLRQLTGAESSLVVNNNAAAVLLALTSMAREREVIVARSQAVEIGGGFRVPDVLRQSGARLVEVGTTNRTYIRDYAAAITPETAAILRVHPSNFRIVGFTHEPALGGLAQLAAARGILLIDDLGSGCMFETEQFGLAHEPTVQESVEGGVDLVCFSSDKLLGGPQGGIILGRTSLIQAVGAHPLFRAVRADKTAIAALGATLMHYLRGEALTKVPVWRMIALTADEASARVENWRQRLGNLGEPKATSSTIGGGSLPGQILPTVALALGPTLPAGGRDNGALTVNELSSRLRQQSPAVVGRIERDQLLLDPRTVAEDEDEALLQSVQRALA